MLNQTDDFTTAAAPVPRRSASPVTLQAAPAAPAPGFRQVRRYLRTVQQRAALDQFIKAGWTPAELAEYARGVYLVPGQTKPTAASYRHILERGRTTSGPRKP